MSKFGGKVKIKIIEILKSLKFIENRWLEVACKCCDMESFEMRTPRRR